MISMDVVHKIKERTPSYCTLMNSSSSKRNDLRIRTFNKPLQMDKEDRS